MALSNDQYNAIIREYNKKQFKNKHIADSHYEEVCNKIDGFAELKQQEAEIAFRYGQEILNSTADASSKLECALKSIAEKRTKLLVANSYPADYLDTKYDCELCQDTGYTADNKQCICFKKEAIKLLYSQSLKKDLYERENFATFNFDYYSDKKLDKTSGKTMREQAKDAFRLCRVFVDSIDSVHGNLLIYGPTGVGKSFLANSIAKELIDTVHSIVHLDAPAFFKQLADYHFRNNEERIEQFSLYDCECLIIDDLGAELVNSFVISSLCECVERRRLSGKSTVFTTNLTPSDLKERYQDRTFSRLISDYTFIRLDGDDIRLLKKKLI